MFDVRVTGPDGRQRVFSLESECSLGRDASNDIPLEGVAVSGRHCTLEVVHGGCVLRECGSTNGTFVNGVRVESVVQLSPTDRIYVGSFLVEVLPGQGHVPAPIELPGGASGPILRQPSSDREWRDLHGRLSRYAYDWDRQRRPARLALAGPELRRAKLWIARTPATLQAEISKLQREFIAESQRVAGRRGMRRVLGVTLGLFALAGGTFLAVRMVRSMTWGPSDVDDAGPTDPHATADADDDEPLAAALPLGPLGPSVEQLQGPGCSETDIESDAICADVNEPISHQVIPFETLSDVARRYGVSEESIADDNLINPDEPLQTGSVLKIPSPAKRPLPQTRITYEVEPGETWTKLASRFDIPAKRLKDYNPTLKDLKAGQAIAVWIDPKPYKPRLPRKPIPEYHIDQQARSIGRPNQGRLENGIQLPRADNLYTRRNPNREWGSSLTIANLQKAVATFRQDVDYDGAVVFSDISKNGGGYFPPHKSHQAGRDIDIWLPTLKGVYKKKYLDDGRSAPRKPHFEEVDWYATWGLVRALIQTDAVRYVFLDWRYQKYVYDAAVNMGATPDELDAWIQYPRSKTSSRAIFRHSEDHLSHIHVRFKCADWETECLGPRAGLDSPEE